MITKIDLIKIEEILKKVGYSKEDVLDFRKKFIETFLLRVGEKMSEHLTKEQQEHLAEFSKNEKAVIGNVIDYLKSQGLEKEAKEIAQQAFDEMVKTVLERLAILASDEQFETMKKMFFAVSSQQ